MRTKGRNPSKEDGAATTLMKRELEHPTEDQIHKRACEIAQARGGAPGQELDDWLQAEREIKAEMQKASDAQP
jgi:hypothetical protein